MGIASPLVLTEVTNSRDLCLTEHWGIFHIERDLKKKCNLKARKKNKLDCTQAQIGQVPLCVVGGLLQ